MLFAQSVQNVVQMSPQAPIGTIFNTIFQLGSKIIKTAYDLDLSIRLFCYQIMRTVAVGAFRTRAITSRTILLTERRKYIDFLVQYPRSQNSILVLSTHPTTPKKPSAI